MSTDYLSDGDWTMGKDDPYISNDESIRCKHCRVEVEWIYIGGRGFPHVEGCIGAPPPAEPVEGAEG